MDYELELNDICCESFFNDYFLDRNTEEYRESWVDEDHDSRDDFVNWFMDMVEEEMYLFVLVNLRTGSDLNERLWDLLVKYGMTNAYRLYKETKGEINDSTSDVDIITCILMSHATDEVPNWMDQMEEAMQELEESDDEWENDELVLSLNHDNCQLEGRHPLTSDEDWELCLRGFTEPYTEELYHTLKRRLEERDPLHI